MTLKKKMFKEKTVFSDERGKQPFEPLQRDPPPVRRHLQLQKSHEFVVDLLHNNNKSDGGGVMERVER
ncbi:hypothetical protein EVAR_9059_1 [Eumeta japonica]|uniref:Uncharacterized protein n=1 Tax=Eumeta variegata TaxID=151549 RepID=A0A4C1TW28_EUMVA|nr:hypothetical protein EVAR_9059_1 [Eumeta japonica]